MLAGYNRKAEGWNSEILLHQPTVVRQTFTTPCKSVSAAAAVADDPSGIEPGSAREILWPRIWESEFLSGKRRSNIVPRALAAGLDRPCDGIDVL
jgi:hypothetical protein